MPRRRIYLPVSPAGLRALVQGRELGPAPLAAYAALDETPPADLERVEHDAWLAAAAAAATTDRRRIVGSADVDVALVAPRESPAATVAPRTTGPAIRRGVAAVEVGAPIPLRHFVSFHVDEEPGGADADLLWYDVTEIRDVLTLVED